MDAPATAVVTLYGRLFIGGSIRLLTGLHIGAGKEELQIGGIDNAVLRDSLTTKPYIPGSSLKGKMRSLWEKANGVPQNYPISRRPPLVRLHICREANCRVCPVFGVPGDQQSFNPTRLVVRDVQLDEAVAELIDLAERTDQTYTEVKYEAAIDRITSAAVPRPMERVPAGAAFGPMEMVFSIYDATDYDRVPDVFRAMQLLEDDYLGGLGSRGSGKIAFQNLAVSCRSCKDYDHVETWEPSKKGETPTVQAVLDRKEDLLKWLKDEVPCSQPTA